MGVKMEAKISEFKNGIFDVEGTLIDNKRFYRWIISKISLGIEPNNSELSLPTAGMPLPRWAKFLHQSQSLTNFVLGAERKILRLLDLIDQKDAKLFEGTKEVLYHFKQKKIRLFATTGGRTQKTILRLKKAGVLELFTLVIGSDLPKREHFKLFAKNLNLPLEDFVKETFLVSDGPVDLTLAARKGIYPIGISTTFKRKYLLKAGAKRVISDLREIVA